MISDLSILYVEDDKIVRENFAEILQQYFSKVITADNGKTALDLYNQHKPDVALLDISIPYISGLQVASKIRAIDLDIQIIMLTAYADQDKLLHAVNLQLFAYMVKPVQHEEFDTTIKNLINKLEKDEVLSLSDEFRWNKTKEELFYKDENIKLTNNERLIVTFLSNNPTQYFKACDIACEISSEQNIDDIECNNVIQLLSRFKNKIIKQFDIKNFFIENSYGVGYKIVINN